MTDWSSPETFWLNMTNAALGLVVLLLFAGVAYAAISELLVRARARAAARERGPAGFHTFMVPGLGTTMADGGERRQDEAEDGGKEKGAPGSPTGDGRGNGKVR
jgi:hypothetical protein